MKNIQYILFLLLAVLLPISCSEQDLSLPEETESDKVNWRIGVTIPGSEVADTRSFGNTDFEFDNLHVAVFVEAGGDYYFEELVQAANTAPTWNETNQCWDFNVALSKTNGPRRLHLIGNYPNLTMGFGEEGQLVGRLITNKQEDGHDVYWNCVEVTKIDEGFEEKVQKVPLVRNYVKIGVNVKADVWTDFQMTGYALYHVPQWGTVTPYNSTNGSFADFVTDAGTCQSYQYMYQKEKYEGNEPNDNGELFSQELDWIAVGADKSIPPTYVYERSNRLAKTPTSMIVKGKYKGGAETFYKLDFVYHDENTGANVYYNLLRNFVYTMNINSVVGSGYATAQEAISNPASNNMGGDAIAKDYTNISDGVGRLFVSTTYLVLTNNQPVDVYYQYIPDLEKETSATDYIKNGDVTITAPVGNVLVSQAVVASSDEASGTRSKWRKVTLMPKAPTAIAQSQTITFAAGGLQREIEILLRTPYDMSVTASPELVESNVKEEVDIKITIPSGIGESLFPLHFFISSEDNTIYPVPGTDMPTEVRNGKYGFIKELTLEEYQEATREDDGRISFTCEFWTNCEYSATNVYVDNEYFNRGHDSFNNRITKLVIGVGTSVSVQTEHFTYNNSSSQVDVYPQKLHNNGTETITVTYGGVPYEISIDKDSVTKGCEIEVPEGFNLDATLTFTFNDNYCTGIQLGSWIFTQYIAGYNWSSSKVTYSFTCTVQEFLNGVTLNFTR